MRWVVQQVLKDGGGAVVQSQVMFMIGIAATSGRLPTIPLTEHATLIATFA